MFNTSKKNIKKAPRRCEVQCFVTNRACRDVRVSVHKTDKYLVYLIELYSLYSSYSKRVKFQLFYYPRYSTCNAAQAVGVFLLNLTNPIK